MKTSYEWQIANCDHVRAKTSAAGEESVFVGLDLVSVAPAGGKRGGHVVSVPCAGRHAREAVLWFDGLVWSLLLDNVPLEPTHVTSHGPTPERRIAATAAALLVTSALGVLAIPWVMSGIDALGASRRIANAELGVAMSESFHSTDETFTVPAPRDFEREPSASSRVLLRRPAGGEIFFAQVTFDDTLGTNDRTLLDHFLEGPARDLFGDGGKLVTEPGTRGLCRDHVGAVAEGYVDDAATGLRLRFRACASGGSSLKQAFFYALPGSRLSRDLPVLMQMERGTVVRQPTVVQPMVQAKLPVPAYRGFPLTPPYVTVFKPGFDPTPPPRALYRDYAQLMAMPQ